MDCHEKLMAKKKKYDARKKHLALLQQKQKQLEKEKDARELQILEEHKRLSANSSRNSLIQSYMLQNYNDSTTSFYKQENGSTNSVTSHKNKSLPVPPTTSSRSPKTMESPNNNSDKNMENNSDKNNTNSNSESSLQQPSYLQSSYHSQETILKLLPNTNYVLEAPKRKLPPVDNDFSIEEVQNSSDSENEDKQTPTGNMSATLRNRSSNSRPTTSQSTPLTTADYEDEFKTPNMDSSLSDRDQKLYLDIVTTPSEEVNSSSNQLKPAADVIPRKGSKSSYSSEKIETQSQSSLNQGRPQLESLNLNLNLNLNLAVETRGKNLLLFSPNQFHDNEFHNTTIRSPMVDSPGTLLSRNSSIHGNDNTKLQALNFEESRPVSTSPFAKANRQARVVETNDEISTDIIAGDDEIIPQVISTPRSKSKPENTIQLSSPPPKVPLPSTPVRRKEVTPASNRPKFEESAHQGLGLEGVKYGGHDHENGNENEGSEGLAIKKPRDKDLDDSDERGSNKYKEIAQTHPGQIYDQQQHQQPHHHRRNYSGSNTPIVQTPSSLNMGLQRIIKNATPSVTNLENLPTPDDEHLHQSQQEQQLLQQQQQQQQAKESSVSRTTSIIRNLKHKRSTSGNSLTKFGFFKSPREESLKSQGGHVRRTSDASVASNVFNNYFNPATFNNNGHSPNSHVRLTSDSTTMFASENDFFDVKLLKQELSKLSSEKFIMDQEFKKLKNEKLKLTDQLKSIQSQITMESIRYDNLVTEIKDLEEHKLKLVDETKNLEECKLKLVDENKELLAQGRALESANSERSVSNDSISYDSTTITNSSSMSSTSPLKGALHPQQHHHHHHSHQHHQQQQLQQLLQQQQQQQQQQQYNHQRELRNPVQQNQQRLQSAHRNSFYQQNTPQESPQKPSQLNGQPDQNAQAQEMQPPPVEEEQTHKATRLKFWRRPKNTTPQVVTTNSTDINLNNLNNMNNSNNQSRIPNSFSSQALRIPLNGLNYNNASGQAYGNSKFSKSTSSNILDTLLNGGGSDSNNNNNSNNNHNSSNGKDGHVPPLFNSSIQSRAQFENSSIPFIITRCLKEVEDRGMDFEGIYRVSGGNSAVVAIENAFSNLHTQSANLDEKQLNKLESLLSDGDIHAVTTALKRYLRKLPDPVVPYALYDEFINIGQSSPGARLPELTQFLRKLPPANQSTLRELCAHLQKVNDMNHLNRMGFKNLSVVFAPTLARDESGEREMTDMGHRNDLTELLLRELNQIFT